MTTTYIRPGFKTLNPYLYIKGAAQALEFYKKAFGAQERYRMEGPGGKLMHAEISIGDAVIMMADEFPEMNILSPTTLGGSGFNLCLYVENCDAVVAQSVAAGAKTVRDVQDQFYGDRSGTIQDPFGHVWTIATHKEMVSPEEMQRRVAAMSGSC